MKSPYIAHVRTGDSSSKKQWLIHSLNEHLLDVAALAYRFALSFGKKHSEWAYLAGIWHDLGKYSPAFQRRIKTLSGYDETAHLEGPAEKVNHSSAGALHAQRVLGNYAGKMLAYLIAGHHAGLPDWYIGLDNRLDMTNAENNVLYKEAVVSDIQKDILEPTESLKTLDIPKFLNPKESIIHSMAMSFWLRMLFSCLVDADFLDTEKFMDGNITDQRAQWPELAQLKMSFDAFMAQKLEQSKATLVNSLRREVLDTCLSKATQPGGIYTLTVPTGGGKTLTALAYALQHALHHGKDRIIYVLPFTSILEQTAAVFREALASVGSDCVVEHHSSLETSRETPRSRLATENWDAPIILTTNVQFFESLFANRTSRCRKIHNIANSVVILDEAQQIPSEFKRPIEAALQLLAKDYKTTIVLSTATQPALDLGETTELAPDPERLFTKLKRVEIQIPDSLTEQVSWESLSEELMFLPKVLCIVNRRDDAKALFQLMPEGTYHLSALMCAAHRSKVIAEIKLKLQEPEAVVQVISTQLVEAGVDMDFPVVYRALAGLDSIAQAAGRCNREGKLPNLGKVQVFIPPSKPPIGMLRKAAQTSKEMLYKQQSLEQTPQLFTQYFEQFYASINDHDAKGIIELLSPQDNKPHFQFKEAASKFQLIDDSNDSTILIPYDEQAVGVLLALTCQGPSRGLLRKLQRYTVSIPKKTALRMLAQGDLLEILPGLYQLKSMVIYSDDIGLNIGQDILLKTASCIM
jgi:CRISPR-associated endonuclease/helicase Cas3